MSKRRMESREAVEVYVNCDNYICIKQENRLEGDALIMLEQSQVQKVIEWLTDALEESNMPFFEEVHEEKEVN